MCLDERGIILKISSPSRFLFAVTCKQEVKEGGFELSSMENNVIFFLENGLNLRKKSY